MPKIKDLQNIDFSGYERVLPDKPINVPDEDEQLIATVRRIVREELSAQETHNRRIRMFKNHIPNQ
jgi:hypothetical protein